MSAAATSQSGGDNFPVDALLLPGGVINPDKLRMDPKAVAFAKAFFNAAKPVAAICHGPWTVIGMARRVGGGPPRGPRSKPIFGTPTRNGWIRNLVSSRKPDHIPAFNKAIITLFSRAHERAPQLA